ncbi:MAG: methionine--tRNA ligase [Synergistaceae bacterium]|nr:methionine--tRNA ligase [Synergistaceae bacterium]
MDKDKTFYITTPIYYVNDVPHIGHAYTTIAADVLDRWYTSGGYDSYFLTGTDEHGQKIEQSAQKRGMTPKELCDEVVQNFKRLWETLNIQNNDFIRTTDKRHEEVVQEVFRHLLAQGDVYKGEYEGWYCVPCETYVPEAQMAEENTCPDCHRPLTKMTEETYFFRLSKYQDALLDYYEKNKDAILPHERYNEVVSFIKSGLKDQSISRTTLKWGIPLPGDDRHVIYVWFDALINYLSAMDFPKEDGKWKKYWPSVRHLVGKDIIRFHCVIWPAMLLALGVNPPVRVFAHGWWTVDGEKMSKSIGNVVDPFEMTELFSRDSFRYFLLREVPFGQDGNFSEMAMASRINSDLANDLGNLLSRSLQMIQKYRNGVLPDFAEVTELDTEIKNLAQATVGEMEEELDRFAFDEALKTLWKLISRANKYIDETEPWKLGKENNAARLDTVLRTLWEVLREVSILLAPFMPDTATNMTVQLGIEPMKRIDWVWGKINCPVSIARGENLFPRLDLVQWEKEKAERDAKKRAKAAGISNSNFEFEPLAEEISIDDFKKVDLRVALIESVTPVPKADKLYKLELNLGFEKRFVVSGIRQYYAPEDLVGKKAIIVANLRPARIRGVDSKGMLLAAENPEKGKEGISIVTILDTTMPQGARVC